MPYISKQAQDTDAIARAMFNAVYTGIVDSMQLEETIANQLLDITAMDTAAEKIGLEVNDAAIENELKIYLENAAEYHSTEQTSETTEQIPETTEQVSPEGMGQTVAQQWLAILAAEKPEGMEDYIWEREQRGYRASMATDAAKYRDELRYGGDMGRYAAYMDHLKENAPDEWQIIKAKLKEWDARKSKKDPTKYMQHPGTDPYRTGIAHASGDKSKASNYEDIVKSFRKRLQEDWGAEIMGNDVDRTQYMNGYLYQLTGSDDVSYTTGYGLAFKDLLQEFGLWDGQPPDPGDDVFIPENESESGAHIAQQLITKSNNVTEILNNYDKQRNRQSAAFMDGYWDAVVNHSRQFSIINSPEDLDRVDQAMAELDSDNIPPSIRKQFEDSLGLVLSPEVVITKDEATGSWVLQDTQGGRDYTWNVRPVDTPEGTVLDIHNKATDVAGYISNYYNDHPELYLKIETDKPYSYKRGDDFDYKDYMDMGKDIKSYYDQLAKAYDWPPEEQAYYEAAYIYQNTRDWKDLDSLRTLLSQLSPETREVLSGYVPSTGESLMDRAMDWFFEDALGAPSTERVPELEGPYSPTSETPSVTEFEGTIDEEDVGSSTPTPAPSTPDRSLENLRAVYDADIFRDQDDVSKLALAIEILEDGGVLEEPQYNADDLAHLDYLIESGMGYLEESKVQVTQDNLERVRTFLQEYEYPSEYIAIVDGALEMMARGEVLEEALRSDTLEFLNEMIEYADRAQKTDDREPAITWEVEPLETSSTPARSLENLRVVYNAGVLEYQEDVSKLALAIEILEDGGVLEAPQYNADDLAYLDYLIESGLTYLEEDQRTQETVPEQEQEVTTEDPHIQEIQSLIDSGAFTTKNLALFEEWITQLESGVEFSLDQTEDLKLSREWVKEWKQLPEQQEQGTQEITPEQESGDAIPERSLENLQAVQDSDMFKHRTDTVKLSRAIEALESGRSLEAPEFGAHDLQDLSYLLWRWKEYLKTAGGTQASKLPATEAEFWKEATESYNNPYDGGGSWRSRGDVLSDQLFERGPTVPGSPEFTFQIGDEGTLAELDLPIVSGYLEDIARDKYNIRNFLNIVNEQDPKTIKFIMSKTKPHAVWEDDNLLLVNLYHVHNIADLMGVLVHDFTHVMSVIAGDPMSEKQDRADATVNEYVEFPEEQDAYIEYIQFRSFILLEPRDLIKEKLFDIVGEDQEAKINEWLYLALGKPIVVASHPDPVSEFYPELIEVLLLNTA